MAVNIGEQQAEIIREISAVYSLLQRCYSEWASNFSSHEDVIRWLEKERINADGIKKQRWFNLHSSYWNGITVSLLKKLATGSIGELEKLVDVLFRTQSCENQRLCWYWLFFLHPVRHELYYFAEHYPAGYRTRQAQKLRSHRMGLKAAKRYISGKINPNVGDPFIKACKSVAFKHLLLFPTTEEWQLSQEDLLPRLQVLDIGQGDLSPDEEAMTILLSEGGSVRFEQWLAYAPCAINEGPIFDARTGTDFKECLNVIIRKLSKTDISQIELRECLHEYFEIKVLK